MCIVLLKGSHRFSFWVRICDFDSIRDHVEISNLKSRHEAFDFHLTSPNLSRLSGMIHACTLKLNQFKYPKTPPTQHLIPTREPTFFLRVIPARNQDESIC